MHAKAPYLFELSRAGVGLGAGSVANYHAEGQRQHRRVLASPPPVPRASTAATSLGGPSKPV